MAAKHYYPQDLARLVLEQLRPHHNSGITEQVLTALYEIMYFASMKTEESEPVQFTLTYIDPENPDPSPPSRIVADRWSYIRFDHCVPLDVSTLVKVAKAIDPSASSLAVHANREGNLYIWGMIDQSIRFNYMIQRNQGDGQERPGEFQATIAGIGNVSVYKGYTLIGSLNHDVLIRDYHDVLRSGPVHTVLSAYINNYINRVKSTVTQKGYIQDNHWQEWLKEIWLGVLCRILLNVQRYQHGGGLLINSFESFENLNAKYQIHYSRLKRALQTFAEKQIIKNDIDDYIFKNFLERLYDEIPIQLYLDKLLHSLELDESLEEIAGCIRFVSSLSRVDGVVLLDPDLVVKGFGAEITIADDLREVFIAGDSLGTPQLLQKVDFNHFGTRHRSMMRYCFQHQDSIGFVISQDRDIRAMMAIDRKLVLWENIKVQYIEAYKKLDTAP